MKKRMKRLMGGMLAVAMMMSMVGCGESSSENAINGPKTAEGSDDSAVSADSPYVGRGYNLTTPETVVMYVLGDRPADI